MSFKSCLYKAEIDAKAEVLEVFSPFCYSGEGSGLGRSKCALKSNFDMPLELRKMQNKAQRAVFRLRSSLLYLFFVGPTRKVDGPRVCQDARRARSRELHGREHVVQEGTRQDQSLGRLYASSISDKGVF